MTNNENPISYLDDSVPSANRITEATINSLVKPHFITICDGTITNFIYSYCRQLLRYSMERHESKEIAYAINLNSLEFVGAAIGSAKSVDIEELVSCMIDINSVYIVLHNHPSNNPFSPRDLTTFFEAVNISVFVVIGNLGSIYTIEKTQPISNKQFIEIKRIIVNYRNSINDFTETIDKLADYGVFCNKF